MKRGVIGVPVPDSLGAADGITEVVSDTETVEDDYGNELTYAIRVQEQRTLTGGTEFYEGVAFRERSVEEDEYFVDDEGKIRTRTTLDNIVQDYTNFVAVPAPESGSHNGYVLVDSSSGTFAFQMIGRQTAGRIRTAELQLGSFYLDREDTFSAQTSGGPTGVPGAGKMTAWGSDVLDTEEVGKHLRSAAHSDVLNQLAGGYVYEKDDDSGHPYEVNMSESGYVEVWDPNDLTTAEFLRWVRAEVLPYATVEGTEATRDGILSDEEDE